jgi:hypothetical protein
VSHHWSSFSTITFDSPYAFTGWIGNVSSIGDPAGFPYTAAVDENTMCFTSFAVMARTSDSDPPRLFSKYFPGSFIDSPTAMNAAKWITASGRCCRISSVSAAVSSRFIWNSRSGGTLCLCPFERSSTTATS